ncbi:hypothetical protein [Cellulophaga baltica]|uniref:hypothetical protein n=1 Tax=Cellulophaga baltica TaxID=76594 RepID=UPI00249591D2|nr:hypothetical protein [Cellulophaga baltica]
MKIIYILSFFLIFGCNNKKNKSNIDSVKDSKEKFIEFTGTYNLDNKIEVRNGETYGSYGKIQIKKLGEEKIAITFSKNKGAPSYNMGGFIDTLKLINNTAIYNNIKNGLNCKITFEFSDTGIIVKEDEGNSCGFGYGVYADGFFKKESSLTPIFLNPFTGKKIENKNSLKSKNNQILISEKKEVPILYNQLFNIKLIGLDLEKEDSHKSYFIEADCFCKSASILMNKIENKIYIYPFCSIKPSKEYNNWVYRIKNIDFINDEFIIIGSHKNKEIKLIFKALDKENVFSFKLEGIKHNSLEFKEYFTNKKSLFKEEDCGDFDG